jgi:hypothetical protein
MKLVEINRNKTIDLDCIDLNSLCFYVNKVKRSISRCEEQLLDAKNGRVIVYDKKWKERVEKALECRKESLKQLQEELAYLTK